MSEGKGKKGKGSEGVGWDYEGRLIEGRLLESCMKGGEGGVLGVKEVMKGWVEGVEVM